MKPASASPETLAREELAIRFVNTVAWRLRDPVEDRAASPEALLKWMVDCGLLDRTAHRGVSARWKTSPQEARSFARAAAELREAIYGLFLAQIGDRAADAAHVAVLNRHLAGSLHDIALGPVRNALKWRTKRDARAEMSALKPIAWSAASLLTGPRASRVKQCQDERGCGWLFIDESRAQNRRWCSMDDCGNLAKSRRHLRRLAGEAVDAPTPSRVRRSS
jgi:predicted RNA-binding Zn ribbon-like protein